MIRFVFYVSALCDADGNRLTLFLSLFFLCLELSYIKNRKRVEHAFESLPAETFERAIYPGGGFARASKIDKVQHVEYHDAAFLLHSDSLKVDVLADKFFHVRDKHSDLRQRAVTLKEMCKELGMQHKFSFIVLDCVTRRVFCAATEHSAPLSFGHGTDGTLVAFCSRIGNKSPSRWPLNGDQSNMSIRMNAMHRHSQDARGIGTIQTSLQRRASTDPRSQDQMVTHKPSDPMTSRQSLEERRPYNWGKEGSAVTGSSDWNDGKIMEIAAPPMSTDAIPITHLPSGRFVYGHKYLQPFEFTSFWSSSSNNRSGVPERRFDAHEFQESQRLMNSDTFVISKSGERKSIDELRCPNDVPRRSLEEHRSRKWATGDHVSDKLDNWRRKSDAIDTNNTPNKKNIDGSVFAGSSFGKSRASTESSNTSRKNSANAEKNITENKTEKKTSIEVTSKPEVATATTTPPTANTTAMMKLEPNVPPIVPSTLSSKSAPFVPRTTTRETDAAKEGKVADAVKRSSSQDHLNTKTSPKTPSGLKKMFANLFRSGKDATTNGANDKEKGAAEGQNGSSIYDTM